NRGMVGADPGVRERRLGEFLDDRLPAVGEPDVDERVTIPVQPHARRRCEKLPAEAGDRGGDLTGDREDGETVPGEERREIAYLAADGKQARGPDDDGDERHGNGRDPANDPSHQVPGTIVDRYRRRSSTWGRGMRHSRPGYTRSMSNHMNRRRVLVMLLAIAIAGGGA